ncbi:hypothetical protein PQR18_39945 [Paraburkholderia sediminicola]
MRETQEVEGLQFAPAATSAVLARKASELDQPRLALVQLQAEVSQPLGHFALEALRVPTMLKPRDPIVGISHDDHVAFGVPRTPRLCRDKSGMTNQRNLVRIP